MHTTDVLEIIGAVLILAAFAAAQLRRLDAHSVPYLVLNVVGAGVLAAVAAADRSWGFLLLEGTWSIVSAVSLAQVLLTRRRGAAPPT
jgi:hypothetical protein